MVTGKDWDSVLGAIKEHGITGVLASGRMTDSALRRLSKLGHITHLDLGGSLQLTDKGLDHLAHMSRLRDLDLSGWKGQLTDRGLEVLAELKDLRKFHICWQQNVTDAGFASLGSCTLLERVNLMGTQAGDTAIRALTGKSKLRWLNTGRGVTDEGFALFTKFRRSRRGRAARFPTG